MYRPCISSLVKTNNPVVSAGQFHKTGTFVPPIKAGKGSQASKFSSSSDKVCTIPKMANYINQDNQTILDYIRMNVIDSKNAVLPPHLMPAMNGDELCLNPAQFHLKVGQSVPLRKKHRDHFTLSTRKLGTNLKHLGKEKPAIVLVLGGSFNPVHRMHVQLFEHAKKYLKYVRGEDTVIGGFMAPSADTYVKGKLGPNAMKFRHRANACQLAVENSPWIDTCNWGLVSVNQICKNIAELLKREFPGREFQIMEICGADYAVKYKLNDNDFDVLCFARNGSTGKLKKIGGNKLCKLSLIEEELDDISSSEVRKKILCGSISDLQERKCLPNGVLEYMMEVGDTLFY